MTNMREIMNLLEWDDEDDEETIPTPEEHILQGGTIVMHGTNGDFDERSEGLESPVWVTDSEETARYFSKWHGGAGKARVTVWRVQYPVRLAVVDKAFFDALEEYQMIDLTDGPHDVLQYLRRSGFDGWIIPDNYGSQQADICLNDADVLEYVKTVKL